MKKALKKILLFELFYKLFIIWLANPFMSEIYQTYVGSRGLKFNKDIIATFANIKGIVIFAALFLSAAILIFYEFSVVINIIALCRRGKDFTMGQVIKGSVWNLKALRGKSILLASVCYVLLIPFVHIGWINSVVPSVEIPYFIIGEMVRSNIGTIGATGIYVAQVLLIAALLWFVPIYMVLEQKTIGRALVENVRAWKKITWKGRAIIGLAYGAFFLAQGEMAKYWRRNVLEYKDFDLDFGKYLVHSQAFRIDLLYWLLYTTVITVGFALFVYLLLGIVPHNEREEVLYPKWENDLGLVLGICGKHLRLAWGKIKCKLRRKRYKAAVLLPALVFAVYFVLASALPIPYIHEPWAIGHRGCKDGIENTMEAIEGAAARGVDYVEIDVQLSADGVPVIVHDDNLWRLAGQSVKVTNLTKEELQALSIRDKDHPGQTSRIPTLEEAIRFAKEHPNEPGLLIELKPASGNAELLAEAITELVERYEFGEKAIFMSLDYTCLYPIAKAHPEWWVGYCIFGSSGKIDDSVWQYDIDFIAAEENQISNRLVVEARAHGFPTYVWTVFDPERMRQYLEMGVTGIISDYPEYAIQEIEKYKKKNDMERCDWKGEGYPKGARFER